MTYQWHFALTCKPESHAALYQEIELLAKVGGVQPLTERHHNGSRCEVWQCRFATRVPLRADLQPLYVNWCAVTITDEATGQLLYQNAWATELNHQGWATTSPRLRPSLRAQHPPSATA